MREARSLDSLEAAAVQRARSGQATVKTVTRRGSGGEVIETTTTEDTHVSDTLVMFLLKRFRPEYREGYTVKHSGSLQIDSEKVNRQIEELLEG